MEPGSASRIELLGIDNRPHYAGLTKTDVHQIGTPFQTTDDPRWIISDPETGAHSESEWLTYYTWDRSIWRTKLHAEYRGDESAVHIWFEHERVNGDDNHNDDRVNFLAWDGQPWWAAISLVPHAELPAAPKFGVFKK
jgi:hypothetical protein